jgi:hypothetical protein
MRIDEDCYQEERARKYCEEAGIVYEDVLELFGGFFPIFFGWCELDKNCEWEG